MKPIKRVISLTLALVLIISNACTFLVCADASSEESDMDKATKWLSCTISQHGCNARDNSCTGCSTMMILQNCGLLNDETWQWGSPGERVCISNCNVKSNGGKLIEDFALQCSTLSITERSAVWWWMSGNGVNNTDLTKWTDGKLKALTIGDSSLPDPNANTAYASECLVGVGGKDFRDMSKTELVKALNLVWDAGLFCIVCGGYGGNNGIGGYTASHASIIAGVSDTEIYIADVWDGIIYPVEQWQQGHIVFLLCYASDETSPIELNGGAKSGKAEMVENDDGSLSLEGFLDEDGFFTQARLEECSIPFANYEMLSQDDKIAVKDWEQDIENTHETRKYEILRGVVVVVGILICVYSLFLYLAFHFDCVNNFVDINLLEILSFGRLMASPEVRAGTTSSIEKVGKHVVTHIGIIKVCLIGVGVGVLLASGKVYSIILEIITLVKKYLLKG